MRSVGGIRGMRSVGGTRGIRSVGGSAPGGQSSFTTSIYLESRQIQPSQDTRPDNAMYPTKATVLMIPWAITSGHSRPVLHQA